MEKVMLPVNYAGNVFNSNQRPFVETFLLETEEKRPLVVVCPGGAYSHIGTREGRPVAKKMNEMGYHALVLTYSIAPMEFPAALCDLAEAVALVRKNAGKWNVDEGKIGVCGFSAGGHLAATLGCYWRSGILQDILPYTPEETRPDFLILCYPVITSDIGCCHDESIRNVLGEKNLDERDFVSIENHIDESFPPTFLWHTLADDCVPVENSMLLASALRSEKIPFEFHLFSRGSHGLALATSETAKEDGSCQERECTVWPELFKNWFEG